MSPERKNKMLNLQPSFETAASPARPAPPAAPPERPDSQSSEGPAAAVRAAETVTSPSRKPAPRKPRSAELPTSEVRTPEVPNLAGPKYLQLERKDTLLWPRQVNELTLLRRRLNRQKPKGEGERITENTLIRVAIDLLLANGGKLGGATEDELRRSLGLRD